MSDGEEEAVVILDDSEAVEEELDYLEDVRVALKPRCNLWSSIKEFRNNEKIGSVELDVYKNFLKDADPEHVYALFDSLGQSPRLQKVTIRSRGSATQSLPVDHLTHLMGEAEQLLELHSEHVKWKGNPEEFEELAATMGEHTHLQVLHLQVESMDVLEPTIEAAGQIPTIQHVEIQTTNQASDKAGLSSALQSLCTSKSLLKLKLIHVTHKFEILAGMARLLAANETMQELYLESTEMDLNGGMAVAHMLTANAGLRSFTLKLDKMHGHKLGDAFVQALEMNSTIRYFQIILDGRMSDMKAVRTMQLRFRDLKPRYNVKSQVGLNMGVTVERAED